MTKTNIKGSEHIGETFGVLEIMGVDNDFTKRAGVLYVTVRCDLCETNQPKYYARMKGKSFEHCGCNYHLIGMKYGALTIVDILSKTPGGAIRVRCLCDLCHEYSDYQYRCLKKRMSEHCGCGPPYNDLTGVKVNMLEVIGFHGHSNSGKVLWLCKCDCGNEIVTTTDVINSGKRKSCGCINRRYGDHGMSNTPEYSCYINMIERCLNEKNPNFHNYGGRGIGVYPDWTDDFTEYYNYIISSIGPKPSSKHTIDRINNDGDYEPGNVRWATAKEQSLNKRTNHLIEYNGQIKTLGQWANESGLKPSTLSCRIIRGWSIKRAIETPCGAYNKTGLISINGVEYNNPTDACRKIGLDPRTIAKRLKSNSFPDYYYVNGEKTNE